MNNICTDIQKIAVKDLHHLTFGHYACVYYAILCRLCAVWNGCDLYPNMAVLWGSYNKF